MSIPIGLKRLWSALAGVATLLAAPAAAQMVSNTATLSWTSGGQGYSLQSNRVDLALEARPAVPITLETYQLASAGGGQAMQLPATVCRGVAGDAVFTLDGAFAGSGLISGQALGPRQVGVAAATQIRAGAPLFFALTSATDNRDGQVVETVTVTLTTPAGDAETLVLRETSADSARFVGATRTVPAPPPFTRGDCALSLAPGDQIKLTTLRGDGSMLASAPVDILIDPFGMTFDTGDASPVNGTRVTLVNVATGQPARVFGDDAVSDFPAVLTTGQPVADSSGRQYVFPPGEYRFPFAAPGRYRLLIEPPAPYTAPSTATPADLAGLRRSGNLPFTLVAGSYGGEFVLDDPAPVRIDVPLDRPGGALVVTKTSSVQVAQPGDVVQYRVTVRNADAVRQTGSVTVTDDPPRELRLQPGSVRVNGVKQAYSVTSDGSRITVPLGVLPGGGERVVTYLLELLPDAREGTIMNQARARDTRGAVSAIADAALRVTRETLAGRMTIIGRITDGGCATNPAQATGVAGVRVMLEDGSYAVSDKDGRYHFEGVKPGTHVVAYEPETLGTGRIPAQCERTSRAADSATSRFVEGIGGALVRVDFRAGAGVNAGAASAADRVDTTSILSDAAAAGGERDWLAGQTPGIDWLFPAPDHNPRNPVIRVAIKHAPGQTVALSVNGQPVDKLTFEGTRTAPDGQVAVSLWRAVALKGRTTRLSADVRDANGTVVKHLDRAVAFSASPMGVQYLSARSRLVADGVQRPVIAVRLTDRDGRPVHHGMTGEFALPAPYLAAVEADAQTARQLSGLERAKPVWRVTGDDGVALIELEPTTASGAVALDFPMRDGDAQRTQRLDLWLSPGNRPWTLVGFASGTVGYQTLKGRQEPTAEHWVTDGRIALYAKGRVRGKWLATLAYDSDKREDETRFGGVIDPQAYYTIYADRSERRYDAASVRKLYLRLERPKFVALFGDFETGMSEPELTRYVRSLNGVKAQYRSAQVGATAFASDTPYRHRRVELQGNGLSGPYFLGSRDILANSERITIEVRDRLRSNLIVESQALTRHVDYDIDYLQGIVRFKSPVLSRASSLDPQFIVADYEVDGVGERVVNGGGRATWSNAAKTLQIGVSGIHDETDVATTNVAGVDLRYTPNAANQVRAEVAASRAAGDTATAWLVEAEHHGPRYDLLAYARQQDARFGVGQINAAETGTRKYGADGRLRLTDAISLIGGGWHEDQIGTGASRDAANLKLEYRGKSTDVRAGLLYAHDALPGALEGTSLLGQVGATQRLFANRLELDASSEIALTNKTQSVDFPARHRFGARFAVTPDIALTGAYEIASGNTVDARTARIGFDVKPWAGARMLLTGNRQDIAEYGPRSYAAYGLAQSLPLGKHWTADVTLDGSKTLGGIDAKRVLNRNQPVASGGFLPGDGNLTEDFTAITAGATYRGERWSWTGRAEWRTGSITDRWGLYSSFLRQLGEGRALGGIVSTTRAETNLGVATRSTQAAVSWAHRPAGSAFAFLEKLELRSDSVTGATLGAPDALGLPLLVQGDARATRLVNSLSVNLSPIDRTEDGYFGRHEVALFWGTRYTSDRFGQDDVKGWSNLLGADVRFDLSKTLAARITGTVRESSKGRAYSFAAGPSVEISPAKNASIILGYNAIGFRDRDYADARFTRAGPYLSFRLKLDGSTLEDLGLKRR